MAEMIFVGMAKQGTVVAEERYCVVLQLIILSPSGSHASVEALGLRV